MQVTASGNGFGLGETADVSVDRGAGNGAQNSSQGPGTSLGLSTSSNQGGNTAPAFNAVVTSSNSATTENQPAASNEAQEGALAEKSFNDLPDAIRYHYRSDPKESGTLLSEYTKVKLILIRGMKPHETAETCKTGCEPGEWDPHTPNLIYIYTGQALAAGITKEGGTRGMMWLIAHEFDHTTAENRALFPEYMSTHPWLTADDLRNLENSPVRGRALPWENNADLFGDQMAKAYDALHPD